MFFARRPSDERLAALLAQARSDNPTFARPGSVERGDEVPGFRRDDYAAVVGRGPAAFERACVGLRQWVMHRGAGLRVLPDEADTAVGSTVLVVTAVGPLTVVVPCRVATTIEGDGRYGFSYVTLPGHPECGEEAFVLSMNGDDVVFTISALSHPADLLTRLGGPVGRLVQTQTNAKYLRAMTTWVASGSSD